MNCIQPVSVKVVNNVLQRVYRLYCRMSVVRLPLGDMQLAFCRFGLFVQSGTYIIEAFKSAYTCCPYRYGTCIMLYQVFYRRTFYADIFRVHVMAGYVFAFHGFESSGSNMQCKFFALNPMSVDCIEHIVCKMQTGGRGGNASVYF